MRIIGVLLLLLFVSACGKSNSNAGLPRKEKKVLPLDGSNVNGLYMAKFFTMNPGVNGNLPGSATLLREGDTFMAYVRLFGGAPNAWHQQKIYNGSRCANAGDDKNRDGYIDFKEGEKVWGKVLLPLDSNLKTQKAGRNVYPMADASGSYFYERETSFNELFMDLRDEDKNLNDNLVKLAPDQGLDFEGKVVVIFGTASSVEYPVTVATADNRPAYQTLPIACGVFKRVTHIPGKPYDGRIPGPIGDVEPSPETPETDRPDYDQPDDDGDYDQGREPRWYRRIIDWWRDTWERERGPRRRQSWGNGNDGWWIF